MTEPKKQMRLEYLTAPERTEVPKNMETHQKDTEAIHQTLSGILDNLSIKIKIVMDYYSLNK